ncbi:MAG: DNA alkylation repair protein [Muribaculaceae bacterium]|nr:DNA alkylation repair protein [Muribaculaceae bacterium]
MITTEKFEKIKTAFEQLRNPEKAKQMSAYMRNQFKNFGIRTPERRASYKILLLEEKKAKCIDWLFLDTCWMEEEREFQYFVTDYLATMQKYLNFDDIPRIERYVRSKQWWDTIDALDMVIGKIGLKDFRVNSLMLEWSTDNDFWVRRIAIDHQLCRKEQTNTELLEKIIVNNFGSHEFFINKAIGWSLRDYSKANPEWVRKFIERHKDNMAPLSIKEASKYI